MRWLDLDPLKWRTPRHAGLVIALGLAGIGLWSNPQIARSEDPTLDWLMKQTATAPSTRPATLPTSQPTSPLTSRQNDQSRQGKITMSDGSIHTGHLATTPDKPVRLWDDKDEDYQDIPWKLIRSMESKVLWQRDEAEWHFKESGSDIKEFTGKTYPAREMQYVITLINGQIITGGVVTPLYLESNDKTTTYVLHKRDKGDVGKTLEQLVYVEKVELEP